MNFFDNITEQTNLSLITHDGKKIQLELEKTKYAENRLHDIQTVNIDNLQELLSVFLCSCHEINRALSVIGMELSFANHKKEIIGSTILIQKMPILIEQCKQRSSEDVRNALISLDPEFQEIKEKCLSFEIILNNLKDKRKVIEMAYFSCQKIAEFKRIPQSLSSKNYGYDSTIQAGSVIE